MRKYVICKSWEWDSKADTIRRTSEIVPTAEDVIIPGAVKAFFVGAAVLGAVGAALYYPDEFKEFTDQFYSTPWYIVTAILGVFAVLLICFVIWGIIREEKTYKQKREGASE